MLESLYITDLSRQFRVLEVPRHQITSSIHNLDSFRLTARHEECSPGSVYVLSWVVGGGLLGKTL